MQDRLTISIPTAIIKNEPISGNVARSKLIKYDIIDYVKYDYPSFADKVKKHLEHVEVAQIVHREFGEDGSGCTSLDIGCATGRYPLWFSHHGFSATGYDIDETAISICREKIEGSRNIRIEKRDVLQVKPEIETYDIITCMMGTFNHFSRGQQKVFFSWCQDSLRPGGLLVLSSWNSMSPFLTLLHFYGRDTREALIRNLLHPNQIRRQIMQSGFRVESMRPTIFLPDVCFDAWMGRVADQQLVEINKYLRKLVPSNEAQMFVCCARKPGQPSNSGMRCV